MKHTRIPETDHGIQGIVAVTAYDEMQRSLRDKGYIATQSIIDSGIQYGHVLEVGHGPGYLGLEWLKQTRDTRLTGLDISPDMTTLATKNAMSYGVGNRTDYREGSGNDLPFEDATFDAVFTSGSLHEWKDPIGTFNELFRVLKPGGLYFISDLRRDMSFFIRWFLWLETRPTYIRPYMFTSIDAAYTPSELMDMLSSTNLRNARVVGNRIDLRITGKK